MRFPTTTPRRHLLRAILLAPAAAILSAAMPVFAAGNLTEQFEKEVRPVLEASCFKCHGAEKQKGGLRLDRKADMLGGGDSGEPAVTPGKSAESALVARIKSSQSDDMMPPKGERLNAGQIAAIERWIDNGAHWPATGEPEPASASVNSVIAKGLIISEKDRQFWAFQPPQRSQPVITQPTDWPRQPLDGFIAAGLEKNGLQPSREASRPVFIRRLTYDITGLPPTLEEIVAFLADEDTGAVERLVERLLASPRFGERLASLWLPLARYGEDQAHQVGNDIRFFYPNAYHYRAWVIGAFNRDLPYDRFLKLQLAADRLPETAKSDLAALGFVGLGPKYYNRGQLDVMAEEWDDRVDTTCRTMLGLTVACARCHDHKFDPISMRDYYALAGVFASTSMVNKTADGQPLKEEKKEKKERGGQRAEVDPALLHIIEDAPKLQNLNVFLRGNVENKGPVVEHRFLEILSPPDAAPFSDGSGRRELAERIASADNPLTARVFVNRVWGLFFGNPLVSTPSNFGHSGAVPTNPELLDDLARRFMDNGWSVKWLVREIACSAAYRQTSECDPARFSRDPENKLLSRMNRRRLTIEQWRDSVLADSGDLIESPSAKSVDIDQPDTTCRTVYARVSRLKLADELMRFDYPDANVHAEKRSITTTPMQKLFMLNSPFILHHAADFAARLIAGAEDDPTRIANAYRILFAREPDETELALAAAFLNRPTADSGATRWEEYAQMLLISNETLYVD